MSFRAVVARIPRPVAYGSRNNRVYGSVENAITRTGNTWTVRTIDIGSTSDPTSRMWTWGHQIPLALIESSVECLREIDFVREFSILGGVYVPDDFIQEAV